jgi:acetyl-CoA acetyltransferase
MAVDPVYVAGIGMTNFGKFLDTGLKQLASEAVSAAIEDAGIKASDIEAAYVGNAVAGLITGQECIRGQVVLRECDIGEIPIFNIENACASAASAFHLAWSAIASGQLECALALGMEKLTHPDKRLSLQAFNAAVDVELVNRMREALQAGTSAAQKQASGESKPSDAESPSEGDGQKRSMFMDIYAAAIRAHMNQYGTTPEQMAWVASKNHHHGALNPRAQYREEVSVEEVLNSRMIAYPLTLLMCAPIGDGAAAAILVSAEKARSLGIENRAPKVLASVIRSGSHPAHGQIPAERRAAKAAYEMAGVGPSDIDVAEVHDATAPAENLAYEDLEFCAPGEGGRLCDEKATALGGRLPVNTSGGLVSKGHPVGATGIAQICEITWQLRGEAGARQVEGARIGLAQNGGGFLGNDAAAQAVHILATTS